MKGKEAIKEIMKNKGETNTAFAEKLDISQQALWDRLNNKKNKDLSLIILCKMARILGYRVVLMPTTKRITEDMYVLTEEE